MSVYVSYIYAIRRRWSCSLTHVWRFQEKSSQDKNITKTANIKRHGFTVQIDWLTLIHFSLRRSGDFFPSRSNDTLLSLDAAGGLCSFSRCLALRWNQWQEESLRLQAIHRWRFMSGFLILHNTRCESVLHIGPTIKNWTLVTLLVASVSRSACSCWGSGKRDTLLHLQPDWRKVKNLETDAMDFSHWYLWL